jgi:hypothetical protein
MNQLFSITYRPAAHREPLQLVCQAHSVGEEVLLWIDGINLEDPVLAPISAVRNIQALGTFREFAQQRLETARAVLQESQGEHSPGVLARAMLCMEADPRMSAHDALELVYDQALDVIDADNTSALAFRRAQDESGTPAQVAAAA